MTNRMSIGARTRNYYEFECWRHYHEDDGSRCSSFPNCTRPHFKLLAWRDGFFNLVTTVGLNKLLDATFKTGLASPAWYVGLVNNASFSAYAAADTMASHAGWLEGTPYSDSTRKAFTPGSISGGSVDNSASKASFTINATLTVRGAFLADDSTKGGSSGTLYGEGDFSAARSVLSGDTLNVTVTLTAS